MKQLVLSLALLVSSMTMSALQISMSGTCGGHSFEKVVNIPEGQNHFECDHGHGIVIKTDLAVGNEDITYHMRIVQKQEDGSEKVISEPVIIAEWNKEAVIKIGEQSSEVNREVELKLIATR